MSAASAAEQAADVVRELAREPRSAGSEAERRAREFCAARLRSVGFTVREEPFDYSSFIGRWGTPIGGLAALVALLLANRLARSGAPLWAFGVLVVAAVALAVVGGVAARSGVLTFPAARRPGVNLVAIRGAEPPTLWLMAHLDSKSQPVPILARAGGITLVGAMWIASIVLAIAQAAGSEVSAWWLPIAVIAAVGAVPVIATTVGSRSPGALDNASGVAAVLRAAETSRAPVGVCLTSAEELGLAGARAWVRGRLPAVAVNCDGIDDTGTLTCMYTGVRPDPLIRRLDDASAKTGGSLRAHRLLPGVLTDGVALTDAGWAAVTISKGGVSTLARIHSSRDRADSLNGTGIAEVAAILTHVVDDIPRA